MISGTTGNIIQRFALTTALSLPMGCAPEGSFRVEISPTGVCDTSSRFNASVSAVDFPDRSGRLSLWQAPPPRDNAACPTRLESYQHVRDAPITGGRSRRAELPLSGIVSGACFLAVFQADPYDDRTYNNNATQSIPGQYRCP